MHELAPELDFAVTGAREERFAIVPTLLFDLRVASSQPVRNVALRCQIRIEPARRAYTDAQRSQLFDLFGDASGWSRSLRGFLWTHVDVQVPAFDDACEIVLPVPCSQDFEIAATKYLSGISAGDAPLAFLFSGSVYYENDQEDLRIGQVSWNKIADFGFPADLWRGLMERYYPDQAWLRVRKETFARLMELRRARGLSDWDALLGSLSPDEVLEVLR